MTIHVTDLDATNKSASTPAPIERSQSTDQPTYLIIDYVVRNGPRQYQDGGPALVATRDYLTFYAAGQADALPLPLIGYEILHPYHHATDLIGARAHYIGWKSRIWRTALNRAVTRIAARSAV